jgi:hypothetical protein
MNEERYAERCVKSRVQHAASRTKTGATFAKDSLVPAIQELGDFLPSVAHPALRSHDFAVLFISPLPFFCGRIELVKIALPALHYRTSRQLTTDLRPLALP